MRGAAMAIVAFSVVVSLLPYLPVDWWWVRVCDFPRLQVLTLTTAGGLLLVPFLGHRSARLSLVLAVGVVANQMYWIFPYLSVAPKEVEDAEDLGLDNRIRMLAVNVRQTNEQHELLLALLRKMEIDVLVLSEVNERWMSQLEELDAIFPEKIAEPLENTYGLACYSRLPLVKKRVRHLVKDDIPSLDLTVQLRNGHEVRIFAVHPEPPRIAHDSTERDAELILVGREVANEKSAIVLGDLNDVGWSNTTLLFQKISRLLDPRKGRGLFATFHAEYRLLRYPLDYVFHSADFRVVRLEVLPQIGSDHFPLYAELSHEVDARREQRPPELEEEDIEDAQETLRDAEELPSER